MQKKLSIKIITLFAKFIEDFAENFGIVKRAVKLKLLDIKPVYLRKFGLDKRGTVDGRPYGGGVGMVLRADVLHRAIKSALAKNKKTRVILLTPQGKQFTQNEARRLSKYDNLVLVCGRYEGFDERVRKFVDEEISLGDYVLMGGELPALTITEAVLRLRPGVLGKDESSQNESFSKPVNIPRGRDLYQLLEYPQYTKPEILRVNPKSEIRNPKQIGKTKIQKYKTIRVPKVLLTGHHKNIAEWRNKEALKRTKKRRPDLLN